MDLIVDRFGHAILTIVERSTSMLFMTKLPHGKKSEPLAMQVRRLLLPYKEYIKTITTDNGLEFAAHKLITEYLGAKGLLCRSLFFMAKRGYWEYEQAH